MVQVRDGKKVVKKSNQSPLQPTPGLHESTSASAATPRARGVPDMRDVKDTLPSTGTAVVKSRPGSTSKQVLWPYGLAYPKNQRFLRLGSMCGPLHVCLPHNPTLLPTTTRARRSKPQRLRTQTLNSTPPRRRRRPKRSVDRRRRTRRTRRKGEI